MPMGNFNLLHMDKRAARVGAISCALAILYFSVIRAPMTFETINHLDKLEHIAAYSALSFFLIRSRLKGISFLKAIILASLFGGLLEIIQYFHPNRDASVWDGIANMIGATFGSILGRRHG